MSLTGTVTAVQWEWPYFTHCANWSQAELWSHCPKSRTAGKNPDPSFLIQLERTCCHKSTAGDTFWGPSGNTSGLSRACPQTLRRCIEPQVGKGAQRNPSPTLAPTWRALLSAACAWGMHALEGSCFYVWIMFWFPQNYSAVVKNTEWGQTLAQLLPGDGPW